MMDPPMDDPVAATNDYATLCKYQAVSLGYYEDRYVKHFLSTRTKNSSQKKAPEINRGYYARSASIAYLTEKYIESHPNGQIISLGAGYDTLFWRLKHEYSDKMSNIKFVEIDVASVTLHKISCIRKSQELSKSLTDIKMKGDCLHSNGYHLLTFDLRQSDKTKFKQRLFENCLIDARKPTLCISECVLVFMPIESSDSLIAWFCETFRSLSFINYEQCNMDDRFGNTMMTNMYAQQCDLMGVKACKSLESQEERFRTHGLSHLRAWTLTDIYRSCLLPSERNRIENIEFLDEGELLSQLLDHYCIIVASHEDIDWITDDDYWFSKSSGCNIEKIVDGDKVNSL